MVHDSWCQGGHDTQLRVGDFLAPSLSRVTMEHALYKLLMLSNSLSALEVDVRRHESCLESVLRSDEDGDCASDMAAMYLTYRKDSGNDRQATGGDVRDNQPAQWWIKISEHQDVELLLESFGMQLEERRRAPWAVEWRADKGRGEDKWE
eukprot:Skav206283  [mRNA]  locus=scaffold922:191013:195632:- [translate_table: standard]